MPSLRPGAIDDDRLDRSRRIAWIDLLAVQQTRCLVVGGGALGNEVLKDLLLSGFEDISIVDMDHVVESNLNRCVFFREEDARNRRMKAEVLAERGVDLFPGARLTAHSCTVEELPSLQGYGVIFGCLDNLKARVHVNSHSYRHVVPFIDGGTEGMSGRVQVVLPPHGPCLQCGMNKSHFKVLEKRFSCSGRETSFFEPKRAAEITTTSIIAAMQVREALKIVSGQGQRCIHHVAHYNGLSGKCEELELTIDPSCPMHEMSRQQ
jgi:molybdopterin/thiamine biosynthesis adenylyltransferase